MRSVNECRICGAFFHYDPMLDAYSTRAGSGLYCNACRDELHRKADAPTDEEKAAQEAKRAAYFGRTA